jgi:hypothetical protein
MFAPNFCAWTSTPGIPGTACPRRAGAGAEKLVLRHRDYAFGQDLEKQAGEVDSRAAKGLGSVRHPSLPTTLIFLLQAQPPGDVIALANAGGDREHLIKRPPRLGGKQRSSRLF